MLSKVVLKMYTTSLLLKCILHTLFNVSLVLALSCHGCAVFHASNAKVGLLWFSSQV